MRKHKSVVAILLAVMMIFTFMPTMAFAGTGTQGVKSWGSSYESATDNSEYEDTFVTTRAFDSANGVTTAVPQDNSNTTVNGNKRLAPNSSALFYDLEGSYFAFGTTKLDGSEWTKSAFDTEIAKTNCLSAFVVQQAYDFDYDKTYNPTPATYDASKVKKDDFSFTKNYVSGAWDYTWHDATSNGFSNWDVYVEMKGYDANATGDQTVTFEVYKKEAVTETTAASVKTNPDMLGTIAKATVTVKANAVTPDNAKYYLDSVGGDYKAAGASTAASASTITGKYDGASHTIVADEVSGWTPSFAVYNKSTGRYDQQLIQLTNVLDEDMTVQVTWKKTGKTDVVKYVKANLAPVANVWSYGFKTNKEVSGTQVAVYDVVGTDYNVTDYFGIAVAPVTKAEQSQAAVLANKAAAAAAIAANESELTQFFNEVYDIDAKAAKGSVTPVTLSMSPKTLGSTADARTKAEKAIKEKYEVLLKNFNITTVTAPPVGGNADVAQTATLNLNSELVDEEIVFTEAPSSKVVHVKKAKKLKKNVSFKVTAVSNKGRAITYKLQDANSKIKIDSTNGTITLKKGLAKGTYKIKVKAYVAGYSNAAGGTIEETQTIKVKIKK
jgi:hypothetical protein